MSSLAGVAMSSVGGSTSAGAAAGGGPTSPPSCACRLCKEKLGSEPIGKPDPEVASADGANNGPGLMRPRNPMNKRTYAAAI